MRKTTAATVLAIGASALALPLGVGASAAAAPAAVNGGGSFYASTQPNGDLSRVTVNRSGSVTGSHVVKAAPTGKLLHPRNTLGHVIAGEVESFSSAGAATEVFTISTSGKSEKLFGAKTSSPSLYRAGTKVAYVKQVGKKYTVREGSSKGGKTTLVYRAKSKQVIDSLAVSANGKTTFIGVDLGNSSAKVFRVTKRKAHSFGPRVKQTQIRTMMLSPNGKTLAYGLDSLAFPTKKAVVLAKVAKGGLSKHLAYQGGPQNLTWSNNGTAITLDDNTASGWAFVNVKSGKVTEDNFSTTGKSTYPTYA